ncbi:pyrophosphatase [Patescibacteria group bacterium]|nr:pyrophosphatase [Patescibacteria group bacterium]
MDLKKLQSDVFEVMKGYASDSEYLLDTDFAMKKLAEEFGEFNQAVLIHEKKCRKVKWVSEETSKKNLAGELADLLGILLLTAELFGIDMEKEMLDKWYSYLKK